MTIDILAKESLKCAELLATEYLKFIELLEFH